MGLGLTRQPVAYVRAILALAVMAVVLLPSSTGRADDNGFYRWGIGWDDGLAGRCMLSRSVGLGVRLDTRLATGISTGHTRGHSDYIRLDWMIFQQSPINKYLQAGPFAELQWAIRTSTWYHPLDRIGFALGVRPALIYKKRFVLESRFGLEFSYQREIDYVGGGENSDGSREQYRSWDYTWDLHSIDDDVNLTSRFRFILMF